MVARIYSSGDRCSIINFVSTIINSEKIKAPPSDSSISNAVDCKNICRNPPIMRINSPAKSLKIKAT